MNHNNTLHISEPTLRRLPLYYQYLLHQKENNRDYISGTHIAQALDLVPIQVRKDLQSAGAVGKPKVGYSVDALLHIIEHFLGYDNSTDAFLVGVGNLGQALMGYDGFNNFGVNVVAAFDIDRSCIGREFFGKPVFPVNKFKNLVYRMNVKIGIITTPPEPAARIAKMMADSGIKGIWNFAPVHLDLPDSVIVQNENLAVSLSMLLGKMNMRKE